MAYVCDSPAGCTVNELHLTDLELIMTAKAAENDYVGTVPATALIFVKARNRYERQNGEQAKAIEDHTVG